MADFKCCAKGCIETIPFPVLMQWRREFCCLNQKQRSLHVLLHVMTMQQLQKGKQSAHMVYEDPSTGLRIALSGARRGQRIQRSKGISEPRLVHYIYDMEDTANVYNICHSGLQKVTGTFSCELISKCKKMLLAEQLTLETLDSFMKEGRERNAPVKDSVVTFLEEHMDVNAEHDPTSEMRYFSHGETSTLHSIYVDAWHSGSFGELGVSIEAGVAPARVRYFASILKNEFSDRVRLPKRLNKFKKCTYCADLKIALGKRKINHAAKRVIRRRLQSHWKFVEASRRKYRRHKVKARNFPHGYV
jgi:hypothetical protein